MILFDKVCLVKSIDNPFAQQIFNEISRRRQNNIPAGQLLPTFLIFSFYFYCYNLVSVIQNSFFAGLDCNCCLRIRKYGEPGCLLHHFDEAKFPQQNLHLPRATRLVRIPLSSPTGSFYSISVHEFSNMRDIGGRPKTIIPTLELRLFDSSFRECHSGRKGFVVWEIRIRVWTQDSDWWCKEGKHEACSDNHELFTLEFWIIVNSEWQNEEQK